MSESACRQLVLDDPGLKERRDALLVTIAQPLVRNIIGRKLSRFRSRRSVGRLIPSLEDLTHDVLEELTLQLNQAASDSPLWETEIFVRYAARAAENRFHDLYRDDLPERERLRQRIHRILNKHRSFAVWKRKQRLICGFAAWLGRDTDPQAAARLDKSEAAHLSSMRTGPTIAQIANILNEAGGPLEFEKLVNVVADLCGISRGGDVSLSEDDSLLRSVPAPGRTEDALVYKEILTAYWSALGTLPFQQRLAVALTQTDAVGDSWLQHVLCNRIATLKEVCRVLGLTHNELLELSQQLPADYGKLAELLETSRENARKLRHRGWKQVSESLLAVFSRNISSDAG